MRTPYLLACLIACSAAAQALPGSDPAARPLSVLIAELSSGDVQQRWAAQRAIAEVGEQAVPALVAAISQSDASAKVPLLMALDSVCCDKTSALPTLRPLLKDSHESVRVAAAASISLIEPLPAPDTLAVLIEGLASSDGRQASTAAFALKRLGPKAEPAVPALTAALRHDDHDTRLAAAFALGAIGPPAASAIPALEQLLDGSDEALKQNAAVALESIRKK